MSEKGFVASWFDRHRGENRLKAKTEYTAKEYATLRTMAGKYTTEEIAAQLGRSVPSVREHARMLQVSLNVKLPRWTKDENSLLRRLAQSHSAKDIARLVGRSENAVNKRAARLGIALQKHGEAHRSAKITKEQVRQIRTLRAKGKYCREICEELGLTYGTVEAVVKRRTWWREGLVP